MNPIFNTINKIVNLINNLIDTMRPSTADSIKKGYLFIIFLLAIGGIIAGINMGKDSARIASSPYIENTNEAFRYSMKREKRGGSYEELIDSELISEPALREREKVLYQMKEEAVPESDYRIIEPDPLLKKPAGPQMSMDERLAEGNYKPMGSEPVDVKPLERKVQPKSSDKGTEPLPSDQGDIRDMAFPADKKPAEETSAGNKPVRKLKQIGGADKGREPAPIDKQREALER